MSIIIEFQYLNIFVKNNSDSQRFYIIIPNNYFMKDIKFNTIYL